MGGAHGGDRTGGPPPQTEHAEKETQQKKDGTQKRCEGKAQSEGRQEDGDGSQENDHRENDHREHQVQVGVRRVGLEVGLLTRSPL